MAEATGVATKELSPIDPVINPQSKEFSNILSKLETSAKEPDAILLEVQPEDLIDLNQDSEVKGNSEKIDQVAYEKKVYDATNTLLTNPETRPFAEFYIDTTWEINDYLQHIRERLELLPEGEEIYSSLSGIVIKQVDDLMLAGLETANQGSTKILYRGFQVEIQDLEQIQDLLLDIILRVEDIAEEHPSEILKRSKQFISSLNNQEQGNDEIQTELGKNNTPFELQDIYKSQPEVNGKKRFTIKPRILVTEFDPHFFQSLKDQGILPEDAITSETELDTDEDYDKAGIDLLGPYGKSIYEDEERTKLPQTIILHVPNKEAIKKNYYLYQDLRLDRWRVEPNKRPHIIVYTEGFNPSLFDKSNTFDGFLFASTPEELSVAYSLAEDMIEAKKDKSFEPAVIEPEQEATYDESDDLREWEHKTADTYQCLQYLLENMNRRDEIDYEKMTVDQLKYLKEYPSRKLKGENIPPPVVPRKGGRIHNVLDIGGGDGRIGGMLARLGMYVMNLDNSQRMLDRGDRRIEEEGAGLRGEVENSKLSYNALRRLEKEQKLPHIGIDNQQVEILIDDDETLSHYVPVKGSFFDFHYDLHTKIKEWYSTGKISGKEIDMFDFFDVNLFSNEPIYNEFDMFMEVGFDKVICTWNTFWEVGTRKNQEIVVDQIFNVISPGGDVTLEIADRNMEPYLSAIQEYHDQHPEEPYGTVQDQKPNGEGTYPKRYITDIQELANMLKVKGLSVNYSQKDLEVDNPESDVRFYYIDQENEKGEKSKMKVYQITAQRPTH